MILGSWFGFSKICKCCSTSSSGCLFSALFSCSPWAIVEISVRYSLPNGHVLGGIYAQVGQRAYPCWATCLPHLGKVRAQKRDKTRLKATVNGEEWQVPDAGTKDWISRKSKRHTRNSTPTATRFSVYTWDSTCRWANTTLTKATCSRPPPERRLQHPAPGEPWQQGVYAHHDTGS